MDEASRATRAVGLAYAAVVALGAHCQHSPWAYAPAPAEPPHSQVFFDSGALVRADLSDGDVVTGQLLVSMAPGSEQLVVCQDRRAPCESVEAAGARALSLTGVQRLRFRDNGLSIGADLGFRVGALVALAHDKEDEGLMILGMLTGAVVGGAIGSRVPRWITVAERSGTRQLTWVPSVPALIPLPPMGHDFATVCRRGDSLPRPGRIVAVARSTRAAFHTEIRRAWAVDTSTRRIIRTRTDGVRCRNQDWPSPGPGASPDLEANALTFRSSAGMARIYVYQQNRRRDTDSIGFKIAIDSQTVGHTANGTYLMSEVEPGPHWVSVPDVSEHVVLLDAVADSVYFVKVSHKVGLKGRPAFRGIERLDAIEGRKIIPTAQLVPPEIPGEALTVERRTDGWQLNNASPARIHFLMVESGTAALMEWTPCVGRDCLVVPAMTSVRIPDTYVVGYAHAATGSEVVVFWWQTVEHPDGTLGADRVRRLVVRF